MRLLENDKFLNLQSGISDEEAKSYEGLLIETKCWQLLSTKKLNRSPGSNGLIVEYYNFF